MENHIYHFSSPKQNSETIVYHNRAKSSLTTSQPSQQTDKILISVNLFRFNINLDSKGFNKRFHYSSDFKE